MQHWFHETLVYGWVNPYWRGLFKVYAGYGASYAASIPINAGLIWCRPDAIGAVLWAGAVVPWVTLVLTGVVNYFVFQRLLGGSDKPPATPRGLYNPGSDGGFTNGTANPLTDVEQRLQPFGQGVNSPQGRKATKEAGQEVRRLRAQCVGCSSRLPVSARGRGGAPGGRRRRGTAASRWDGLGCG